MSQLRLEFFYPHPPQTVWRALTESHVLALWLVENDLVARPGHRFRMRALELAGLGELVNGDVLDVVEGERIAMIWRTGEAHLGMTWQLRPSADGTVLQVVQSGFLGVGGRTGARTCAVRRARLRRAAARRPRGAREPARARAGRTAARRRGRAGGHTLLAEDPMWDAPPPGEPNAAPPTPDSPASVPSLPSRACATGRWCATRR
ncbi:SRPBCC domain-containing protein [Luedemannella flava]